MGVADIFAVRGVAAVFGGGDFSRAVAVSGFELSSFRVSSMSSPSSSLLLRLRRRDGDRERGGSSKRANGRGSLGRGQGMLSCSASETPNLSFRFKVHYFTITNSNFVLSELTNKETLTIVSTLSKH